MLDAPIAGLDALDRVRRPTAPIRDGIEAAAVAAGLVNAEGSPSWQGAGPGPGRHHGRTVGPPLFESLAALGRDAHPGATARRRGPRVVTDAARPSSARRRPGSSRRRRRGSAAGRRSRVVAVPRRPAVALRRRHVRAGVAGRPPRRRAPGRRDHRARRRAVRRAAVPGPRRTASTTPSTCTTPDRAARSSSPAAASRATGSPRRRPATTTCATTACPTSAIAQGGRRAEHLGVARAPSARFLQPRTSTTWCSSPTLPRLRASAAIAEELGLDASVSPDRHSRSAARELQPLVRETVAVVDRPDHRLRPPVPDRRRRQRLSRMCGRARAFGSVAARPFGGGVIGNTAGSGPVVGGSSPPPRATSSNGAQVSAGLLRDLRRESHAGAPTICSSKKSSSLSTSHPRNRDASSIEMASLSFRTPPVICYLTCVPLRQACPLADRPTCGMQ